MSSIFNTLNIGYTGLSVAQAGIATTGHNISNAETEGYTRQRVISTAAFPVTTSPGLIGNGVEIQEIERVFDNFVFDRYTKLSGDKEFSDFERKTLEELSTYFPEIDQVGIKEDLQEYFNMWQSFADNPDNNSIKLALTKQTELLASHITQTQDKVLSLQSQINNELGVSVDEVNEKAKQISEINLSIETAESDGKYTANDLRDKRNVLEKNLAELIGAKTITGQLESNTQIKTPSNSRPESYTISVNGHNIVDGASYHPIHISKENNPNDYYEISYERQDGTLISIAEDINGGKIGSILNLRGASIDMTSGKPTDGVIQTVISQFDAFAKGLIESTNNLYASSSVKTMQSNVLDIDSSASILNSTLNVKEGAFDLVVYDLDGNITAKRTINIDVSTTIEGISDSNSIEGQINTTIDDNDDMNANNDIDDFITFNWATFPNGDNVLEFSLDSSMESKGYTFAIEDVLQEESFASGSNFAGALGLSRFFDGDSASNIKLNHEIGLNSTIVSAGSSPIAGDNKIALNMMQQQFEKFDFKVGNIISNSTIYGMFDVIATDVGISTNSSISRNETISAQFNATELEYSSVSKVSIDEELTNLIRYQTAYGAAAKVITTVDQMMQTLLGIKQ